MATTQIKPEITASEIRAKLEGAGIRPGAGWSGYEKAKRLLIGDAWIDDSEYNRIIATILDILEL